MGYTYYIEECFKFWDVIEELVQSGSWDVLGNMGSLLGMKSGPIDENQVKEDFINEGRGHSPSHFKFFLLVFSKLKEDIK